MEDRLQRKRRGYAPLGLVLAGILFVLGLVLPAFDYLTRPNYEARAKEVRQLLLPIETLPEFVATAEEAGLSCQDLDEAGRTIIFCRWTQGHRIYNWVAWLEGFPRGVVARGEFVDGRKAAEYQVSVQTMGP
jgi:hypothetical protein